MLLSDQVLGYYPLVNQLCLPQLGTANRLGGIAPSTMIRSGADTTALFNLLSAEPGGDDEGAGADRPGRRRYDRLQVSYTDELVSELNDNGDGVTYDVYPGVDHGGVVSAAEDDALAFFRSKLPSRR